MGPSYVWSECNIKKNKNSEGFNSRQEEKTKTGFVNLKVHKEQQ